MIDRKYIKGIARNMVRGRWFRLLMGFIPMLAVILVISVITSALSQLSAEASGAIAGLLSMCAGGLGIFYACAYFLKFIRTSDCRFNSVFKAIRNGKHFLHIVVANLITFILVGLGMALLIIPGLILAAWLFPINYVLVDDPSLTFVQAIKISRKIMRGRTLEYIGLLLSFIGWIILGLFTFGILYLWLVPYMQTTMAIYYHEACGIAAEDARIGDYYG